MALPNRVTRLRVPPRVVQILTSHSEKPLNLLVKPTDWFCNDLVLSCWVWLERPEVIHLHLLQTTSWRGNDDEHEGYDEFYASCTLTVFWKGRCWFSLWITAHCSRYNTSGLDVSSQFYMRRCLTGIVLFWAAFCPTHVQYCLEHLEGCPTTSQHVYHHSLHVHACTSLASMYSTSHSFCLFLSLAVRKERRFLLLSPVK